MDGADDAWAALAACASEGEESPALAAQVEGPPPSPLGDSGWARLASRAYEDQWANLADAPESGSDAEAAPEEPPHGEVAGGSGEAPAIEEDRPRLLPWQRLRPRGGRPRKVLELLRTVAEAQPVAEGAITLAPAAAGSLGDQQEQGSLVVRSGEATGLPAPIGVSRISKNDLSLIARRTVVPYVPSPISQHLPGWTEYLREVRAACGAEPFDSDVFKVAAAMYIRPRGARCLNTVALCDKLHMTRWKLIARETRLAAAVLWASHCEQQLFEVSLAEAATRGDVQLLLCIEIARMDETPMMLRSKVMASAGSSLGTSEGAASALLTMPDHVSRGTLQHLTSRPDKERGTSKLLQVETEYAYLVAVTLPSGGKQYCLIHRSTLRRLHLMDRATGECLRRAVELSVTCTTAVKGFNQLLRVACNDKAGSNPRAEVAFYEDRRRDGWSPTLMIDCQVHIVATIHGHTFGALAPQVTGLIRVALSLASGTHMSRFRKCVAAVLQGRLRVRTGIPPEAEARKRAKALCLFAARGARVVHRLAAQHLLPNGNWADSSSIDIFVPANLRGELGDDKIKQRVVQAVLYSCCSSPPVVYSRSRWTGMDLALDCLGRLSLMHNILQVAYVDFVRSFKDKRSGDMTDNPPAARLAEEMLAVEVGNPGGARDLVDPVAAGRPEVGAPGVAGNATAWQAEMAEHRRQGLNFIEKSSAHYLVLMRMAVEPLRQLLKEKLEASSQRWEQQQELLATTTAQSAGGQASGRSYRVVLCATNFQEGTAHRKLGMLFKELTLWELMPAECTLEKYVAEAFVLLSREGALIEELLAAPHRQYPFRAFLGLLSPQLAAEVQRDPPCIRDRSMSHFFTVNDITTTEGRMRLWAIATVAKTDTSGIECLHAAVRRIIKSMSLQTHTASFPILAAKWQSRRWKQDRCPNASHLCEPTDLIAPGDAVLAAVAGASQPEGAAARQHRGGGGAWRAFLNIECAGQAGSPDLRQMASAYRNLSEERRAALLDLGAHATQQHRLDPTRQPFGVTEGEVRLALQQRRDAAVHERVEGFHNDADINRALASSVARVQGPLASLEEIATEATRQTRRFAAWRRGEASRRIETLKAFATTGLRDVADALSSRLLRIPPEWKETWLAIPSIVGAVFKLASQSLRHAVDLVAFSMLRGAMLHSEGGKLADEISSCLEADWVAKHDMIPHDVCRPITAQPTSANSPCCQAGRCVCTPAGKRLASFRARFLKCLAYFCPPQASMREELRKGHLVLQLVGINPDRIEDEKPEGCLFGAEEVTIFVHIAAMYLSPFRPTLQLLSCKGWDGAGEVVLEGKVVWQTLWDFCARCDATWLWSARPLQICFRQRPVPAFDPSAVRARVLAGDRYGFRQFWDPAPARRPRGSGKWARLADELADVDVDAVDDGEEPRPDLDLIENEFGDGVGGDGESDASSAKDGEQSDRDQEDADGSSSHGGGDVAGGVEEAGPGAEGGVGGEALGAKPAECVMHLFGHGKISYYRYDRRAYFQAVCSQVHEHGRCVLTRTAQGAGGARGRPLGYLAAWLLEGSSCATKAAHIAFKPSQIQRSVARIWLREETEEFGRLEAYERPVRADESGSEPEGLC